MTTSTRFFVTMIWVVMTGFYSGVLWTGLETIPAFAVFVALSGMIALGVSIYNLLVLAGYDRRLS